MQQPPNTKPRGGGKRVFRYLFADLDCQYCREKKECRGECLCPYIFGNLHDLARDPAFILAIKNAEICETPQGLTLRYLAKGRVL
jgi:hypothetical protein